MQDTDTTKEKQIITPDGKPLTGENETERAAERKSENTEFVPVIVKRSDETFRHPDDILENAIHEGMEQHARPVFSLFLSAVAAGMILCFTVLAVAVMASIIDAPGDGFGRVIIASVYPLGFVLVILSRTQLFTEHTATAVYPVLDARASLISLLRLWFIVICGNMLGGAISAAMLIAAEDVIGAKTGYFYLAEHLLHFPADATFISAILAGWLMALGAWIVLGTHSSISQILSIYIVTFVIGLGGLHHSIAGSIELMAAGFSNSSLDILKFPKIIGVMLIGNLIGGSIFVAVLNYGHIRQSQRLKDKSPKLKRSQS